MSAKKRKNGARRQRCDLEASPRHRINLPLTKLLKRPRAFASIGVMSTTLIETRPARPDDAVCLAETHDEAWRTAYQGLIPGPELEKLITRRGPSWWDTAIRRGSRISLLIFGDEIAGYANYGRNRAKSLPYAGEVYELYLRPEYQGLGFGRRLFSNAKRDLAQSGQTSMVVWVLSDNGPAVDIADVAHGTGQKPRHHQHLASHLTALVVGLCRAPAHDRRERPFVICAFLDPPFDLLALAVERGERLMRGRLLLRVRTEADHHALVARAHPHRHAAMALAVPLAVILFRLAGDVAAFLHIEIGECALDRLRACGRGRKDAEANNHQPIHRGASFRGSAAAIPRASPPRAGCWRANRRPSSARRRPAPAKWRPRFSPLPRRRHRRRRVAC